MPQVVIDNPVINSAFAEPTRHFRFTDEGITNQIVEARRRSQYFVPIAKPKKKGSKQLQFDTEWTQDRIEENELVNQIRSRVRLWREGGYAGVTPTTASLIAYWTDPDRERKLFFCQIEALETAIYITEVARKYGDAWIENRLRDANDTSNPGLYRLAMKMATGSGKTVVMAMLIAWHVLNKLANPQDPRFSDTFLIVTPGITIRDRLRVLLPNDPQNYYRQRDIVRRGALGAACTGQDPDYQLPCVPAARNGRGRQDHEGDIWRTAGPSEFTETPDQMVRRVCRELGGKKNIIVINDEAHHCYRRKPDGEDVNAHRRRPQGSRAARRRGPCLDFRNRGSQSQDRRKGHLRPLGHAVFPPRLGLAGGHALPLGRLRFLPDRRHRGRHRQSSPRPGCR